MVGDGVGHQRHPAFPGYLLHHLRLANARRPHEQNGTLPDGRDGVFAQSILGKVVLDEEEFTGAAARPQRTLADALSEEDDLYRDLNNS